MKQTPTDTGSAIYALLWFLALVYVGWKFLYYVAVGKKRGETIFGTKDRKSDTLIKQSVQSSSTAKGSNQISSPPNPISVPTESILSDTVNSVSAISISTTVVRSSNRITYDVPHPVLNSEAMLVEDKEGTQEEVNNNNKSSMSRELEQPGSESNRLYTDGYTSSVMGKPKASEEILPEGIQTDKETINQDFISPIILHPSDEIPTEYESARSAEEEHLGYENLIEPHRIENPKDLTEPVNLNLDVLSPHPATESNASVSGDVPPTVLKQNDTSDQPYSIRAPYNGEEVNSSLRVSSATDTGVKWMGKKTKFTIGEFTIHDGMVYFGKLYTSLSYNEREPSLIDPTLPIGNYRGDQTSYSSHYFSSYDHLSPFQRKVYLNWLAEGRPLKKSFDVSYVKLFVNGLERRVLNDLRGEEYALEEAAHIYTELKRLYKSYEEVWPINDTLRKLIEVTNLIYEIEPFQLPSQKSYVDYQLPLALRLQLGWQVRNRTPIPSNLALLWVAYNPNYYTRTPFERCRAEFEVLFSERYSARFGEGIKIPKSRLKGLSVQYNCVNSSLRGVRKVNVTGTPDVSEEKEKYGLIKTLFDECTDALNPYSRYLGRLKDQSASILGYALLPDELFAAITNKTVKDVVAWCRTQSHNAEGGVILKDDLLRQMKLSSRRKFSPKDLTGITELLRKAGIGIEPDYRFNPYKIERLKHFVLFSLESSAENTASEPYKIAMLFLQLAVGVSSSNRSLHTGERQHLLEWVASLHDLSKTEKERLRHYTEWLSIELPDISQLKKRLQSLSAEQTDSMMWILIEAATVDGAIEPAEIKMLQKVYTWVNKDPENIYSDITKLQSDEIALDRHGLTSAKPTLSGTTGTTMLPGTEKELKLDRNKIQRKIDETKQVKSLLMDVFDDVDEIEAVPVTTKKHSSRKVIPGLDQKHSQLVYTLPEVDKISREEFEELCENEGLFADGAMELINDASFIIAEQPLIDDDGDLILINQTLLQQLRQS
ncbi:MAG: TerB N-terminal domain-containing protein [Bacteroidetes bacterium]|nr:TerB N-terminal domain-containing protein [Bacteroidota bacterium]